MPIRPDWELLLVLHEDMFDASVLVFPQESPHLISPSCFFFPRPTGIHGPFDRPDGNSNEKGGVGVEQLLQRPHSHQILAAPPSIHHSPMLLQLQLDMSSVRHSPKAW